jgi:hypothetical protein
MGGSRADPLLDPLVAGDLKVGRELNAEVSKATGSNGIDTDAIIRAALDLADR